MWRSLWRQTICVVVLGTLFVDKETTMVDIGIMTIASPDLPTNLFSLARRFAHKLCQACKGVITNLNNERHGGKLEQSAFSPNSDEGNSPKGGHGKSVWTAVSDADNTSTCDDTPRQDKSISNRPVMPSTRYISLNHALAPYQPDTKYFHFCMAQYKIYPKCLQVSIRPTLLWGGIPLQCDRISPPCKCRAWSGNISPQTSSWHTVPYSDNMSRRAIICHRPQTHNMWYLYLFVLATWITGIWFYLTTQNLSLCQLNANMT